MLAQLGPVGVPRGAVRIELTGALDGFDRRYRDGALEELAADLASPALGADRIPSLSAGDARLATITGNPAARINLGRLTATADASRSIGVIGLAVGLTSRITVFGRLPLMRTRVTPLIALDSTSGNAGMNPADPLLGTAQGAAQTTGFLADFDAALTALQQGLASGTYADDVTRALAQSTLASGTALRADLGALLADPATASPFLPTASSPEAAALAGRIEALQATLASDLGVGGFATLPALPTQRASQEQLEAFLTDPAGTVGGTLDEGRFSQRGDAEAGIAFTLVDRWNHDARGTGLRAAVAATARFPTGFRERANRFIDVGTGTGHRAVDVALTTDVGAGRFGARVVGSYERSFAADYVARVTPPDQPFAPSGALRTVRAEPGDVVSFSARPFVRLLPPLALQAGVSWWRRGAATVTYATDADSIPGMPASVLARDTRASATILSAGLTYAADAGRGGRGLPLEASWAWEQVVDASGGRVPKVRRVRAEVRIYVQLFD